MNLVIDIGNSRIKWASTENSRLHGPGAVYYPGRPLAEVFTGAWGALEPPSRVVCTCVAGGQIGASLADWLRARYGVSTEFVSAQAEGFGVRNGYREPDRLGADRWAALIGARRREPRAVCVVDCGTAITIDALADDGRHLGGLIAPGVMTMRRALYEAAAGIVDEGEGELTPLAADTRSGVSAGTLYAAAAFIDRGCAEIEQAAGHAMSRLLTGGGADVLRPLLKGTYAPVPDLVLEGLAVIAA